MKKLFEVITTLLCVNYVTPVLMYYIYDDNPTVGFIGVDNVVGEYVASYSAPNKPAPMPYGSRFQKYTSEHVVDSHFKIMKSPSRYTMPTLMDRNNAQRRNEQRMTAAPKPWPQNNVQPRTTVNKQHQQQQQQLLQKQNQQQQQLLQQQKQQQLLQRQKQQQQPKQQQPQTNNSPMTIQKNSDKNSYTVDPRRQDNLQRKDIKSKDKNILPLRPKVVNTEYTSPIKQRPRSPDSVFEPKSNFVQMNVRKTQILQDPQKLVRLNNNIQLKAASVLGSQNERQRIPTSMIMDKTLHKTNGLGDHNMQAMSQVLGDINQKVPVRHHNKRENRRTDPIKSSGEKDKRNFDNMKKYFGNERTKELKERKSSSGTGDVIKAGSGWKNHNGSLELKETPYALFYRMNPESVDQQEAVVLLKSMDVKSGHELASKDSRHTIDIGVRNAANRKSNTNSKRLRKKMKLLINYDTQK